MRPASDFSSALRRAFWPRWAIRLSSRRASSIWFLSSFSWIARSFSTAMARRSKAASSASCWIFSRLPIGNVRLQAGHRILAAPELSLNAVRILDLANRGEQPLLPGKVSLYVDGAFLGFTELDFIAPGEDFELFLGVVDHLKLARSLDRRGSELSRRGARTKLSVSFRLRVENLSGRGELVELRDRIPVSQTDQIRVSGVKVSPEGQPDAKGLLSWSVRLAPGEAREYRVAYTIEYPTELPAAGGRAEEALRTQLRSLESLMTN